MKNQLSTLLVTFLIIVLEVSTVQADEPDLGYHWQNHAGPFIFRFNNLIDNHQQMRLLKNGALQGFIYIQFTGEYIDGIPIARRANCYDESLDCRVGWEVIGVPVRGVKLIQRGPRLWEIDPTSMPADPGFVHFHWTKLDTFDPNPKKPCGLITKEENGNISYNGYLFKRTAVTSFYWLGGNPDKEKGRLVTPGVDLHSNIYGIWSGGGGDGGEGGDHEEGDCGGHETGG